MSPRSRRRLPRAVAFLGTAAAVAATGLAAAPAAQAGTDSWNCYISAGSYCNWYRHSLRAVSNYNPAGRVVAAGASFNGNTSTMHGSWSGGNGYTCHSYSGANILYPLLRNGSGSGSTFYGASSWGTGAPSC